MSKTRIEIHFDTEQFSPDMEQFNFTIDAPAGWDDEVIAEILSLVVSTISGEGELIREDTYTDTDDPLYKAIFGE